MGKNLNREGPGRLVVNINIILNNYHCRCTRTTQKETESEETISFVIIIFVLDGISIEEAWAPLATLHLCSQCYKFRTFRVGTGTNYTLDIGEYEGDAGIQ